MDPATQRPTGCVAGLAFHGFWVEGRLVAIWLNSPDNPTDPSTQRSTSRVAGLAFHGLWVEGRLLEVRLHQNQGGLRHLSVIERHQLIVNEPGKDIANEGLINVCGLSSGRSFISVVFQKFGLSIMWSFKWLFFKSSLSKGWSFIKNILSGWSFKGVVHS